MFYRFYFPMMFVLIFPALFCIFTIGTIYSKIFISQYASVWILLFYYKNDLKFREIFETSCTDKLKHPVFLN